MKTKKVLKIIGIAVIIALVLLIIHTIRNYIIIKNLQDKIAEYSNNQNHHIRIVSTQNDGTILNTDYYKKDNKKVAFIEREKNGEIIKISMYDNGDTHHTYTDAEDKKIVSLNSGFIEVQIYNVAETTSFGQTIYSSIFASIKKVKENGKEYYQLRHTASPYAMSFENDTILVDKETGLMYKNINDISTVVREYEFNNVDESIFIEPDITEYTIQEN